MKLRLPNSPGESLRPLIPSCFLLLPSGRFFWLPSLFSMKSTFLHSGAYPLLHAPGLTVALFRKVRLFSSRSCNFDRGLCSFHFWQRILGHPCQLLFFFGVQAFLLKSAPFCTLFAGLAALRWSGCNKKIAISRPFSRTLALFLLRFFSPPLFLLSHTLCHTGRKYPFFLPPLLPGYNWSMVITSFGNDAVDELTRWSALLQPSTVSYSLFRLTSGILSSLFPDWTLTVLSKFFDTLNSPVSAGKLVLLRHVCCFLSRLCCNTAFC